MSTSYIQGKDAMILFTDPELLSIGEAMSGMFWWRQSYRYRSNWRTLHVDGLEGDIFGNRDLPSCGGEKFQFFRYKVGVKPCSLTS